MRKITYTYGPDPYHQLDLYIPHNASSITPLIIFIHGGAWWSEDKKDNAELLTGIANQELAVASINYRLRPRDAPAQVAAVRHPAHVDDAAAAFEFLRQLPLSKDICYDPTRIYLVGHSAGAHIAMTLLLDPRFQAPVKGVVGVCGIYDLPTLVNTYPSYLSFVSLAFGDDPQAYSNASPVNKFPQQPVPASVLVVHSREDELLNTEQSYLIFEHLRSLGVDVAIDLSIAGKHDEICKSSKFLEALIAFVKQKEL